MSISMVPAIEDSHARRWRQWQVSNELSERRRAIKAQAGFTILFVSVAAWLGFQLLTGPLG